ncbi:MAG: hypothetical protein MZW92_24190 [Comamonadaceae bacterium]|nr:hypothetical protein [Comamonadaceae bacterium]
MAPFPPSPPVSARLDWPSRAGLRVSVPRAGSPSPPRAVSDAPPAPPSA